MKNLLFARTSAIIITVLSLVFFQTKTWMFLYFSLGISHILLGLYYSKNRFLNLSKTTEGIVKMLFVVIINLLFIPYISEVNLNLAGLLPLMHFAFHHSLNETYSLNNVIKNNSGIFSNLNILNHFLLYLLLSAEFFQLTNYTWLLRLIWIASTICILINSLKINFSKSSEKKLFYLLFLLELTLFITSMFKQISPYTVIFYHGIWWISYPLSGGSPQFKKTYIINTLLVSFVTLSLNPDILGKLIFSDFNSNYIFYANAFKYLAWFHITVTFAFSDYNPQWIKNFFKSKAYS